LPPGNELEQRLLSRKAFGEFVLPSYQDYCLSSVPSTVLSMFGTKSGRPTIPSSQLPTDTHPEKLVLFVADGLGYYDARLQFGDGNFFQRVSSKDALIPITTIFPSTTAAALTTLSTGLTPQEHCLPEWFVYMKEIEKVIATLPFSAVGQRQRDSLKGILRPRALFYGTTIAQTLKKHGVDVLSFVNSSIARSVYSRLSQAGSETIPYITTSDLMASLRRRIESASRPTYFYVYWEKVDTIGHMYGPASDESRSEVALLSYLLKTELLDRLSRRAASETTLMVTADHGQVAVEPESTRYLNSMRPVTRALQKAPSGKTIPPWGSARDVYLALREGRLGSVKSYLQRELGDSAVTLETKDAVRSGLFGLGTPRRRFLDRVGNLMILPRKTNLVWYKYSRASRFDVRGHHGGMNPREMLIPFVLSRISDLR
jgi:hypothetical protein